MDKRTQNKIGLLAREGKPISKILNDDYPEYDYGEIYLVAYGKGERSARGVKRVISNRLNALATTKQKSERAKIIDEVGSLVWNLYERVKSNQEKLDKIRKVLK